MGLFSRKNKQNQDGPAAGEGAAETPGVDGLAGDTPDADVSGQSAPDLGDRGPYDISEAPHDPSAYVRLGSIWVKGIHGMQLQLEINQAQQQVSAVTASIGDSAVQLQAFAAPRTQGVWVDIRNEIAGGIDAAGGSSEVITGVFGEELVTRMPQTGPDGRTVFVPARFVGIDGRRWFLRAVVTGRAVVDPQAAAPMNEIIASVVVDRGTEAMPPRELLPLHVPEEAPAPEAQGAAGDGSDDRGSDDRGSYGGGSDDDGSGAGGPDLQDLRPFERGPEITEIR